MEPHLEPLFLGALGIKPITMALLVSGPIIGVFIYLLGIKKINEYI